MQPTYVQVQRSLEALRAGDGPAVGGLDEGLVYGRVVDLPRGLLDLLRAAPSVRLDRMTHAKMRLEFGRQPTDEDLADRLVGRLVCDRLR